MTNEVGVKLKQIRELKNLRRTYVAEELGITNSALGRIERGECDISVSRLKQFAEIFEIEESDILSFSVRDSFSGIQQAGNGAQTQRSTPHDIELDRLRSEVSFLRSMLDKFVNQA